jgi:type IV pilus assembly protein PilM
MASTTPTGVDIGSASIRAVETNRAKDHSVVTNFGQAQLPTGAVQGGVVNDEKVVIGALKHLWAHNKFRNRSVVLGVTSHQIVVREVTLANLPSREFRQALPFLVRDMIPLSVDKALLDFYPLEKVHKSDETVRGLLIAAPKEIVLPTVHTVEKAGLKVVRVDLASFAILRSAARLAAQVEAIADIGAHTTSVVIHVDGQPRIVRTIPRGGVEITDAIANRLHIPPADAEVLKCRGGLSAEQNPQVAEVIREALKPLVSELRSSFEYLAAGIAGDTTLRVASLALCGGSANMRGLVEALGQELGIEVLLADPLVRVRESRHRGYHDELTLSRSSAAVSVGLALAMAS